MRVAVVVIASGSVSCADANRQGMVPGRLFGEIVRVIA